MRFLPIFISATSLVLGGCHSARHAATRTQKHGVAQKSASGVNIAELREKAEQGDAEAQTQLGAQYVKGEALEKDIDAAICWWKKAADSGYAEAQYKLGICYHFGFGVKKSRKLAKRWYEKAASQHHRSAEAALKIITGEESDTP